MFFEINVAMKEPITEKTATIIANVIFSTSESFFSLGLLGIILFLIEFFLFTLVSPFA